MQDWTDEEVADQISRQRAGEGRYKRHEVACDPTSFAVRCLSHGRRMLTHSEMGLTLWNTGSADMDIPRPCPICKKLCKLDRDWHENVRNSLSSI